MDRKLSCGMDRLLRSVFLATLLLTAGCSDPQAEANKRVVETSRVLADLTPSTSLSEKIGKLEKAEKLLASIPEEFAETSVAVDIVAGRAVGGYSLIAIRNELATSRLALEEAMCMVKPTADCIAREMRRNQPLVAPGIDRSFGEAFWTYYLLRQGKTVEAKAQAESAGREQLLAWAPELDGRPFTEIAQEVAKGPERHLEELLRVVGDIGDKAALGQILSDPLIIETLNKSSFTSLNSVIAGLNLEGVPLEPAARERLAASLIQDLQQPQTGFSEVGLVKKSDLAKLDQNAAAHFVAAMGIVGATDKALTFIQQFEAQWRQALKAPSASRPAWALVEDGVALATILADLKQADLLQSVAAATFTAATEKSPRQALSYLLIYCDDICATLDDKQFQRIQAIVKGDVFNMPRGYLTIALLKTGRQEQADKLISQRWLTLSRYEIIALMARPEDYPQLKKLLITSPIMSMADAYQTAGLCIDRLKWGAPEERDGAINELIGIMKVINEPHMRVAYLRSALLALPKPQPRA